MLNTVRFEYKFDKVRDKVRDKVLFRLATGARPFRTGSSRLTCRRIGFISFLLAFAAAITVQAHKLKVFAAWDGEQIGGYVYFAGGGRAVSTTVTAADSGGAELAVLQTDGEGMFTFKPTRSQAVVFTASTVDGHRAVYTVQADDKAAPVQSAETPSGNARTTAEAGVLENSSDPTVTVSQQDIEQIVSRQIRVLREDLAEYRDDVRLHDIIGGLGVIAGFAGFAMYLKARRLLREGAD